MSFDRQDMVRVVADFVRSSKSRSRPNPAEPWTAWPLPEVSRARLGDFVIELWGQNTNVFFRYNTWVHKV